MGELVRLHRLPVGVCAGADGTFAAKILEPTNEVERAIEISFPDKAEAADYVDLLCLVWGNLYRRGPDSIGAAA